MISGEDSVSYVRRAFDLGVADYIKKPFDAQVVYKRVYNTITLYAKQRRLIEIILKKLQFSIAPFEGCCVIREI